MQVSTPFCYINQAIQQLNKKSAVSFCSGVLSPTLEPLAADTVELNPFEIKKAKAQKVYDRFHKFDINSYKSLTSEEIELLRDTYEYDTKSAAHSANVVGVNLKNYLDNAYGTDNYVFVSIGTSPAPLARSFEFSGVETKYLPISDLKSLVTYRDPAENKKVLKELAPQFENYLKFLDEQGLSKEKIENSDKQYLFLDYTFSGRSLKAMKYLFTECFGIDTSNVKFVSLNRLLDQSIPSEDGRMEFYVNEFSRKYMKNCEAEKYGGVPHLPIDVIDTVDTCKNYSDDTAKQFNFILIDYLNEQGLLKYNPLNEDTL